MCSVEAIIPINPETASKLLSPIFQCLLPSINIPDYLPYTFSGILVGGLAGATIGAVNKNPDQIKLYTKAGVIAGGVTGAITDISLALWSILQN